MHADLPGLSKIYCCKTRQVRVRIQELFSQATLAYSLVAPTVFWGLALAFTGFRACGDKFFQPASTEPNRRHSFFPAARSVHKLSVAAASTTVPRSHTHNWCVKLLPKTQTAISILRVYLEVPQFDHVDLQSHFAQVFAIRLENTTHSFNRPSCRFYALETSFDSAVTSRGFRILVFKHVGQAEQCPAINCSSGMG